MIKLSPGIDQRERKYPISITNKTKYPIGKNNIFPTANKTFLYISTQGNNNLYIPYTVGYNLPGDNSFIFLFSRELRKK